MCRPRTATTRFSTWAPRRRFRQIAETSPEPIHLPQTIDVGGETATRGGRTRALARSVCHGLPVAARHAEEGRSREPLLLTSATANTARSGRRRQKRRMYLLKGGNIPLWAESPDDGRYSIKGNRGHRRHHADERGECAQDGRGVLRRGVRQARRRIPGPDRQPAARGELGTYIFNVVHDELDAECRKRIVDVARCAHEAMQRGMRLAGIVDLPTRAGRHPRQAHQRAGPTNDSEAPSHRGGSRQPQRRQERARAAYRQGVRAADSG